MNTEAGQGVRPEADFVPIAALRRWLTGRLPVADDLVVGRVSTGHSNEMFRLRTGSHTWLLRRPPRVRAAAGAHDMAREFRLLSALEHTDVPHAQPLALCEDPDVIGAPFLIQSFVTGFPPTLPLPQPFTDDVEVRRELAFGLVEALARVAAVDWRAVGLEGFGRPDCFLDRQVDRWLSQLAKYRTRDLPWLDELADWLRANRPAHSPVGLIHGDYTWSNVMFAPDRPGRVAAIVDWELATIGDPLIDIGWLLGLWLEEGEEAHGRDQRSLFCRLPGNPTRLELLARYREVSPLPVERIDYYQVLALFKLSCIIEGSWYRYQSGKSDDPAHATFERRVPALLARAARIAGLG
ncbi:phosphotransferase family protein [Nocardia sp. CA-135953]|uniref:phosphotransferase family protein n=1 Tax=Nocardia sp. CA-135953 TaxID=3239978 RepID=UPI003D983547